MTAVLEGSCKAVLFDLDGTLVDTAPDMVGVLQAMQRDHGISPVVYDIGRSHVSNGAVGLLRLGFPDSGNEMIEKLRVEFLDRYTLSVCERSRVFTGLDPLLDQLDGAQLPWGVVTNKPTNLTNILLDELQLADRVACSVGGDALALRKPDPAPLLHACELTGVNPSATVYIGDSSRDIEAGRAAGMATIASAYGYITPDDNAADWAANAIARDTKELAQIVLKAVNLDV